MLFYQISNNWNTGTKVRYVGKRSRQERDPRDDLASYTTFDQTLSYTQDALTLRASVKNLFNKDVKYPAPLGNGITSGTYKDDLQRDGRVFWFSAQWSFQ
jgi:outer membrane receptor protein involved in Fe transport